MIKTPEQIEFERRVKDLIEQGLRPLRGEIEKVTNLNLKSDEEYHNTAFQELLPKIPLATRFKTFLEMEYLNIIVAPASCCTDEEFREAEEWATNATRFLIHTLRVWEKQGKISLGDEDLCT